MRPGALISQSLHSVWGNKIRSGLTVLGIVIGIAAVIALVGMGNGLQQSVTSRLGTLGSTKITVNSQGPERQTAQRAGGPMGGGGRMMGGFSFASGNEASLSEADFQEIQNTGGIALASPAATSQVDVALTENADQATAFQLHGVGEHYIEVQDYPLIGGAFLSADQVANSESVAVIGEKAAEDLFGKGQDPLGMTLYIKDQPFTVIGVLGEPESSQPFGGGGSPTDALFTGYRGWLSLNGKDKFSTVVAKAESEEVVQSVAAGIKSQLLAAHDIADEANADVSVITSQDLLNTMSSVTDSFTATLAGIAAISLVVGGIGIMNIMLVTVTERTREIGLRRAVGAKTRHIMAQFLTESVLLTLAGGAIGLLLAIGFSQTAAGFVSFGPARGANADIQVIVDAQTAALALSVSAAVGIVFGLFPAVKAAKLEPVEALRYE